MLRRHSSAIFLSLFILLFFLLRLPSLFEPYWYGDEGIYLTLGQSLRRGLVLYRQIHDNKPPLLYYLAALAPTVFSFRLLLSLWLIPAYNIFYRLCLRLSRNLSLTRFLTLGFLILTSIPLVEGNIANAEIFMLLPTLAGVYLAFIFPNSPRSLFLSGLLLGVSFTLKVPVIIELAFLIFWQLTSSLSWPFTLTDVSQVIRSRFFALLLLILGFSLPTFLWAIYFAFKGALPQLLYAALFQNIGYLASWATGTQTSSVASSGLLARAVVLLITFVVLAILSVFRRLSPSAYFVCLWYSATLFGATLSERPYPHYLIQVLPPLLLVIFLLFQSLWSRTLFLILLASLASIILKYKFYFYPTFSYYRNFYSYILNRKSQDSYYSYFGPRVSQNLEIASYLTSRTTPTDRLFVWGDEPYLYPLTHRLPASKYTVAYHIVDFHAYTSTIDSLKTYLPKFIVTYPMANRPFPEFDSFLYHYYFLDRQVGDALLYQLR